MTFRQCCDKVNQETKERYCVLKNQSVKKTIAKIIRILTVPPIMSLTLFCVLYACGGVFANLRDFIAAIVFLSVFPSAAYALRPVIPYFRDRGRSGQRTLAMIMSCLGYVFSIVYSVIFRVGTELFTVFMTYLLSGAVLLILNKVFGIKASGHACGLMGPVAVLAYFTGWLPLVIGTGLFLLTMWGSLKIKRHTAGQFIVGAFIPVVIFFSFCMFR